MVMRIARPTNMLTTGEVAMLLGVSRNTVLRMAHSGKLPSVRANDRGDFLFEKDGVLPYVPVHDQQLIPAYHGGRIKRTRVVEPDSAHQLIS